MNFAIRQERQGDTLTMFLTGEFNKLAMDAFDKDIFLRQGCAPCCRQPRLWKARGAVLPCSIRRRW